MRTREKVTVMFIIRRYTPADKRIWDLYVAKSKNATFLFRRDYMDYHSVDSPTEAGSWTRRSVPPMCLFSLRN